VVLDNGHTFNLMGNENEKSAEVSIDSWKKRSLSTANPAPSQPVATVPTKEEPAATAKAEAERVAAEKILAGNDTVSLIDKNGKTLQFKHFFVNENGKETDMEHAVAAVHGIHNVKDKTFTFTHSGARSAKTGEFELIPGSQMPQLGKLDDMFKKSATVPVIDGALHLTDEKTGNVVSKLANAAVGKEKATVDAETAHHNEKIVEARQKSLR
jgi:hypothetical protein